MFYATVNITFVKLHQTDNCVQKKQNYTLSFHVAKIFFILHAHPSWKIKTGSQYLMPKKEQTFY